MIDYLRYCDLINIPFRSKRKKTKRRRKKREVGGRERRRKEEEGNEREEKNYIQLNWFKIRNSLGQKAIIGYCKNNLIHLSSSSFCHTYYAMLVITQLPNCNPV